MCGFAGIIVTHGGRLDPNLLQSMADLQNHRGPDGEGLLRLCMANGLYRTGPQTAGEPDFDLGLAFRRLAVVDLSRLGDQPMANKSQSIWLVFNGEIYNDDELRRELQCRGYQFKSKTDTEVVLALYEEKGLEAIQALNGMFALAIWDQNNRQLVLARDRLGIKPLYFCEVAGAFLFSSEIKSLFCHSGVRREIDLQGFSQHFAFQYCLEERTMFSGIRGLEPGTIGVFRNGRLQTKKYWEMEFDPKPVTEQKLILELRNSLRSSVRRQLRSDVPVGTFLSGGMDTGAISAFAQTRLDSLHSFTCGFSVTGIEGDERYFDERPQARELSERLGTWHHEIEITPHDLPKLLPLVAWHLEEPCVGISYQNFAMAKTVGDHVVVVLSGVGGDEILGGYPWRLAPIADITNTAKADRRYYEICTRLLDQDTQTRLFSDAVRQELKGYAPLEDYNRVMARCYEQDPIHRALYFDAKGFLRGLLKVEDKLTMAHSVESRVPLLDNEMIDCALKLPAKLKFDKGQSKVAFRKALDGILPKSHIERRKQGFTPPDATWFRGPSRPYIEALLLSEQFIQRGYFRVEGVREILQAHFHGKFDHRFLIWSMMSFEWMHRLFIDRNELVPPSVATSAIS